MPRPYGVANRQSAPLQERIAPEQALQNLVTYEKNAGKRSNFREMLRPLNTPVEEGMRNKYLRDETWRVDPETNENIHIRQYQQDFEAQKEAIYTTLITLRNPSEWDASTSHIISLLKELQQVILTGNADALSNMRGQMGFVRMGGRSEVGTAASEALARIIDRAERGMQITEEARRETSEAITQLIRQQIGVHEALANATLGTQWDDLNEETKAHVYRFYMNFRFAADEGTFKRNAELRVLTERENAPYRVRDGRERQVYAAILEWRALDEKLKAENDPEERLIIQDEMRKQEEVLQRWTSELTGTFNGREEDGAVGVNQVKQSAWSEIRHTFDRLRDKDGKVHNTFIQVGATFDQGSWEGIGLTSDIYFQFGAAQNARKILRQVGALPDDDPQKRQLIEQYFPVEDRKREVIVLKRKLGIERDRRNRLQKELDEAEREFRESGTALAIATQDEENAKVALKNLAPSDEESPAERKGGGGGRRKGVSNDLYSQALARVDSTGRERIKTAAAQKAADDRQKKLAAELGKPETGGIAKSIADLEKQIAAIETNRVSLTPEQEEELYTKKRRHFDELLKKLERFTSQEKMNEEFYTLFRERDVETIAKLNGMETFRHERTKLLMIGQRLAEGGNVVDQETKEIVYEGDYAFINAWALGEQEGQVSPDIIEQMLNNPAAYPQVKALIDEAERKGKIVIVTSFTPQNDVSGGITARQIEGSGREFNFQAADELKKAHGWTDTELFMHWLDDLNIQTELGVRPEEIERRYMEWASRNYLLRQKHFSANGKHPWTFINTTVATSTPMFFETTIRRMVDAGLPMSSQALRQSPFFQQLGKSNEYAVTITDKNQVRKVYYRGQELTSMNERAEKTFVARLYKSLMNELELYYSRTFIGGQSTNVAEGLDEDGSMRLGAFTMANMEMIRQKMMTLKGIYQDPNLTADERLKIMNDWSQGRLSYSREQLESLKAMGVKIINPDEHTEAEIQKYLEDGYRVIRDGDPDPGMTNLTYELLDENGNFIPESGNEELWVYMDAHSQWIGKLGRNLREATLNFSNTMADPYATPDDKEIAKTQYLDALGERRNWEMRQKVLGMQVSGQLKGMDNKEVGGVLAKTFAGITMDQMRRLQEQQMRAIFELDDDLDPSFENAARIIIGKLTKSRIADVARGIGARFGIGDRFLREVDQHKMASWIRNKHDSRIYKVAAAHYAHAVQTRYQANTGLWDSLFHPETSDLLYPGSGAPGIVMSRTGEAAMKGLEERIEQDVGDILDRTIGNNMHLMVRAARNSGWTIDEMLNRLQHGEMNDTQTVEYNRNRGQFQWNLYGKKPTKLSMVEDRFINDIMGRSDRSGWTQNYGGLGPRLIGTAGQLAGQMVMAGAGVDQRPADSRYVPYRRSDPPLSVQFQMKQAKIKSPFPEAGAGPYSLVA